MTDIGWHNSVGTIPKDADEGIFVRLSDGSEHFVWWNPSDSKFYPDDDECAGLAIWDIVAWKFVDE